MKILKVTGLVVVVLFLLFLCIGLLFPAVHYTSSVTVAASPEKCWAVFHDTSKMAQWTKGFESLKIIHGDSLVPGTIYELIITQDKRMIMSEKVLEVAKPVKVVYELNNDVLQSECRIEFIRKEDTTQIISTFEVVGNNPLWRSLFVLMQAYFQTENSQQLERLKRLIEST